MGHGIFMRDRETAWSPFAAHDITAFMAVQTIANDKLMWYVIIHMTFVLSALGMAYVDRINKH